MNALSNVTGLIGCYVTPFVCFFDNAAQLSSLGYVAREQVGETKTIGAAVIANVARLSMFGDLGEPKQHQFLEHRLHIFQRNSQFHKIRIGHRQAAVLLPPMRQVFQF
jgi:hypothetical protein